MTRAARVVTCAVSVGALLAGCAIDAQTEVAFRVPRDEVTFANDVQPILEMGCATLDCHGQRGRPLRLYSTWGLRIDDSLRPAPGATLDAIPPIRSDEVHANVSAIAGIDVGLTRVDDSLLLRKPLDPAAGGIHHVGRIHWRSTDDPEYQAIRTWLETP